MAALASTKLKQGALSFAADRLELFWWRMQLLGRSCYGPLDVEVAGDLRLPHLSNASMKAPSHQLPSLTAPCFGILVASLRPVTLRRESTSNG